MVVIAVVDGCLVISTVCSDVPFYYRFLGQFSRESWRPRRPAPVLPVLLTVVSNSVRQRGWGAIGDGKGGIAALGCANQQPLLHSRGRLCHMPLFPLNHSFGRAAGRGVELLRNPAGQIRQTARLAGQPHGLGHLQRVFGVGDARIQ